MPILACRARPWVLLLVLLAGRAALAGGLDCTRAGSRVEQRLCADGTLRQLDQQIEDVYQRQLTEVGEAYRPRLQTVQQAWLGSLSDEADLKGALRRRLERLRHAVVTVNSVSLLRLDGDAHPPYVLSPLPGASVYNHWVDRVWQELPDDLAGTGPRPMPACGRDVPHCDRVMVRRRYLLDYVSPEVLSLDAVLSEQVRPVDPVASSEQHLHWWLSRSGQIRSVDLFPDEAYRRVITAQVRHYLHDEHEVENADGSALRDAQNPASWALGARSLTVTGQGYDYGMGPTHVEIPIPWKLFADTVDAHFLDRIQRYPDPPPVGP